MRCLRFNNVKENKICDECSDYTVKYVGLDNLKKILKISEMKWLNIFNNNF